MKPSRITIIGMGPRGLSLLEGLAESLLASPVSRSIEVHLVEPGDCGQGAHPASQPGHLLTNTVASQVGIFARNSRFTDRSDLSFTQWARLQGYRKFGNDYLQVNDGSGAEIADHDYLPRNLLGKYLSWAYDQIVRALPANVRIQHHRRRAVDLLPGQGGGFEVCLDNGFRYASDYVFIATGHGTRAATASDREFEAFARSAGGKNSKLDFFASPYPIAGLGRIAEGATVAIQGLGLTAYDVISELSIGRGGSFIEGDGKLIYRSSGHEPKILLFSRNCLPFAARGVNQKGIAGRHQARFFTVDAVRALQAHARSCGGNGQLDFVAALLPLIEKEMAFAYRLARQGDALDAAGFEATDEERLAIARLLNPLKDAHFSSFERFAEFFRALVEADLNEAHRGNLTSPIKAATDALRDIREALRAAVEFAGLTPASHRTYVEDFVATNNRISFGPPRRRNAELLALMDAGLVAIAGGPGNHVETDAERGQFCIVNRFGEQELRQFADVLVIARLDPYSPKTDSSELTHNLVRRGWVRPHLNGAYHPGGLDITPDLRVIDRDGKVHQKLWAIGFPVEGPHFYTHALPRPLMNSRFTQDAQRCIGQLMAALAEASADETSALAEQTKDLAGLSA